MTRPTKSQTKIVDASFVHAPYGGHRVDPEPQLNKHDIAEALAIWDTTIIQKALRQHLPYEWFCNGQGSSLVHQALFKQAPDVIEILLENNYLNEHLNWLSQQPQDHKAHYLLRSTPSSDSLFPLPNCVVLFEVLQAQKWHINNSNSDTQLHSGNVKYTNIVQIFLNKGVDPNQPAPNQQLALEFSLKEALFDSAYLFLMSPNVALPATPESTIFSILQQLDPHDFSAFLKHPCSQRLATLLPSLDLQPLKKILL